MSSSAHKIHLSAETTINFSADRISTYLPRNYPPRYRNLSQPFIVCAYNKRIVCIIARMYFEQWIVVNIVVQFFSAHNKGCNNLARMNRFFLTCDNAFFNCFYYAVGNHFCVNTQMLFAFDTCKHSIRNAADYPIEALLHLQ